MGSEVHYNSKIQNFYEDKVVLLTGGTGFLGKILVEKLLRSCPNIKKIYLLIREKNGMNADDRLGRLLEDTVFLRLKRENPRFMERLFVLHGDLYRPRLGLNKNNEELLIQNVNIIIHSAATLRFDEQLSTAITVNVKATKQLCLLAQEIINLKALVYVSTAYSNCDTPVIRENICLSSICPDKLIALSEILDGPELNKMTPILLGSKPNTYIFTKCAAEEIVFRFKSSLPVAILRPSIVVSTMSEPVPGWIDNLQGPTGVAASMSAGLLRTVRCNSKATANIVPVDLTANAIIALAYSVATKNWQWSNEDSGVPVINFVSTAVSSITWGQFGDLLKKNIVQNPSTNLVWYPFITRPCHPWAAALHCTLLHYLPAYLIDFLSAKCGHPTRLKKLYHRLDKYVKVVNYFSTRHFDFEAKNAIVLWNSLELQDQELFPFNMDTINWDIFILDYVLGCRQYLLKEDPDTIEQGRQRMKMLYFIHRVTKTTLILLGFKYFWRILKFVGTIKYGTLSGQTKTNICRLHL